MHITDYVKINLLFYLFVFLKTKSTIKGLTVQKSVKKNHTDFDYLNHRMIVDCDDVWLFQTTNAK